MTYRTLGLMAVGTMCRYILHVHVVTLAGNLGHFPIRVWLMSRGGSTGTKLCKEEKKR